MKALLLMTTLFSLNAFAISSFGEGSDLRGNESLAMAKAEQNAIANTQTKCIQAGGQPQSVQLLRLDPTCDDLPGTRGQGVQCVAFATVKCISGQNTTQIGQSQTGNLQNKSLQAACGEAYKRATVRAKKTCMNINAIDFRNLSDRGREIVQCERKCTRSQGKYHCQADATFFCVTEI